jgi:hypothetical protein
MFLAPGAKMTPQGDIKMKRQTGNLLVAISMLLLVLSVSAKAQSAPDLEVSDLRYVYDVNANFESRAPSERRISPASTVTSFPVQQVSALFTNTGAKSIKAVTWEYVIFKDAQETELLHVYTIRSKTALLPGQSARLDKTGYQLKNSQHMKARVTRIEYTDGTIWQGAKTKR